MSRPSPAIQGQKLSEREVQVLARIAAGRTDASIARELSVSPATVAAHASRIFAKFGVHCRAHAVACGYVAGYLRVPKWARSGGASC